MNISDFLSEAIGEAFGRPDALNAAGATTPFFDRVAADPLLILILLATTLSVGAFLMALIAFFRRSSEAADVELIDQRFQTIEALLRDQASASVLLSKKISSDSEYLRLELAELRSLIDHIQESPISKRRIANG